MQNGDANDFSLFVSDQDVVAQSRCRIDGVLQIQLGHNLGKNVCDSLSGLVA
jgi:hypothetical protein